MSINIESDEQRGQLNMEVTIRILHDPTPKNYLSYITRGLG